MSDDSNVNSGLLTYSKSLKKDAQVQRSNKTPNLVRIAMHLKSTFHNNMRNFIGDEFQAYLSSLPSTAHIHLGKELDWDNEGVDRDLNEIAYVMLEWEEKLSAPMKLTDIDIHDIKANHLIAELQR